MEAIEPIEINVELNTFDILRYIGFFLFGRGASSILSIIGAVVLLLASVYLIFLLISDSTRQISPLIYLPAFTFVLILSLLIFAVAAARKHRKKTQITFNSTEIQAVTSTALVKLSWSRFTNIYETKKDFMFFAPGNESFIIPKRFFDSGRIDDFRRLLRNAIGTKAKLKK